MANLPETPQWEDGIYQIEVSDPVLGGPDGISNRQAKQLASRTSYLKQKVEKGGSDLAAHIAAPDPHTQYAPKASPTFTGTPTAPTAANNDNSKKLATTEFVAKALAALAGSAPETLDTLKELADALGNDPNFATTVLNKLAEKLAKDQNGADIPDPALFVKNLGLTNFADKNSS
ncbi:phage tail protein, partial [Citrobacter freundii]|nr:phage tail protein [Citrobacter freundii]